MVVTTVPIARTIPLTHSLFGVRANAEPEYMSARQLEKQFEYGRVSSIAGLESCIHVLAANKRLRAVNIICEIPGIL